MPSGEHAIHNGAAEGRHHAKADEHDGRHQLEAETGAARARRNLPTPPCSGPKSPRSPAAPPRGPRLEPRSSSAGSSPGTPQQLYRILAQGSLLEPCGSSVGSSPPTIAAGDPPPWPGCPLQARPTRSLACFMGYGAVIPPHSLVDKPGPPRAWQFLAVSNSATKTLTAFHRKAWAQTQAFLQDGLWGPRGHRCQGIQWAPPHARTQGTSGPSPTA